MRRDGPGNRLVEMNFVLCSYEDFSSRLTGLKQLFTSHACVLWTVSPPNRDGVVVWKTLIPPGRDLGIYKQNPGQAGWLACQMNENIGYEILFNKARSRQIG